MILLRILGKVNAEITEKSLIERVSTALEEHYVETINKLITFYDFSSYISLHAPMFIEKRIRPEVLITLNVLSFIK